MEAQIALIDEQLSRTRILAPFDAVVVKGTIAFVEEVHQRAEGHTVADFAPPARGERPLAVERRVGLRHASGAVPIGVHRLDVPAVRAPPEVEPASVVGEKVVTAVGL